jgi:hypothetical protein
MFPSEPTPVNALIISILPLALQLIPLPGLQLDAIRQAVQACNGLSVRKVGYRPGSVSKDRLESSDIEGHVFPATFHGGRFLNRGYGK